MSLAKGRRIEQAIDLAIFAHDLLEADYAGLRRVTEQGHIPRASRTRHEAFLFVTLQVVEERLETHTGALLSLGHYFLERDCEIAKYYFERHLAEDMEPHPGATEALTQISNGRCGAKTQAGAP